jgi:hypothetical protein
MKHPFIVPCVETWMVQDHTVNMIYRFCEKGDLATYLQKVQKQASAIILQGLQQTCSRTSSGSCCAAAQ